MRFLITQFQNTTNHNENRDGSERLGEVSSRGLLAKCEHFEISSWNWWAVENRLSEMCSQELDKVGVQYPRFCSGDIMMHSGIITIYSVAHLNSVAQLGHSIPECLCSLTGFPNSIIFGKISKWDLIWNLGIVKRVIYASYREMEVSNIKVAWLSRISAVIFCMYVWFVKRNTHSCRTSVFVQHVAYLIVM